MERKSSIGNSMQDVLAMFWHREITLNYKIFLEHLTSHYYMIFSSFLDIFNIIIFKYIFFYYQLS